jgi:hypothetical protein
VKVRVVASAAPTRARIVTGVIRVAPAGSAPLRVPWALSFAQPPSRLLGRVALSADAFKTSDTSPSVLTVQAGELLPGEAPGTIQVQPVGRLDVLLYTAGGRFVGLLARLRNLLPGSYSFGITGRSATSVPLAPGRYELRLVAWPTIPNDAKPTNRKVRFRIE